MTANLATLATLASLRRRELDEARAELSGCLDRERDAAARMRDAEADIRLQQEAASALDAPDHAVEAFGRWLPRGRAALAAAEAALTSAESASIHARAKLMAARAAAEAATMAHDAARAAIEQERERRLQAELDEAGRRPADD